MSSREENQESARVSATEEHFTEQTSELIASSKRKFALAQARLRRGQVELALLSFYGSLEDALRNHLLLQSHPAHEQGISSVLEALRNDTIRPLPREEGERVRRMHSFQTRIARGQAVTLTHESIHTYHQFVATVLSRYGVTVVPPETEPAHTTSSSTPLFPKKLNVPVSTHLATFWQQHQERVLPFLALFLLFLVGATITILIQFSRSVESSQAAPTATPVPYVPALMGERVSPTAAHAATPMPIPTPDPHAPEEVPVVAPTSPPTPAQEPSTERTASVRNDAAMGLAMRASPGTSPDIPILMYLNPGTEVTVLQGPVDADGYTWWHVRFDGRDGWCAGEFLDIP